MKVYRLSKRDGKTVSNIFRPPMNNWREITNSKDVYLLLKNIFKIEPDKIEDDYYYYSCKNEEL